jgi:hypothetical protein
MRKIYPFYAFGILALYAASWWNGWELRASQRDIIPAGVRQSPGGYRSYSYWRGGK